MDRRRASGDEDQGKVLVRVDLNQVNQNRGAYSLERNPPLDSIELVVVSGVARNVA